MGSEQEMEKSGWSEREGHSELGFELAARIGFFFRGRWWAGPVRRTRPGVLRPPRIRPIFGLDMTSAGQSRRLRAVRGARLGSNFMTGQRPGGLPGRLRRV